MHKNSISAGNPPQTRLLKGGPGKREGRRRKKKREREGEGNTRGKEGKRMEGRGAGSLNILVYNCPWQSAFW